MFVYLLPTVCLLSFTLSLTVFLYLVSSVTKEMEYTRYNMLKKCISAHKKRTTKEMITHSGIKQSLDNNVMLRNTSDANLV